MNFFSGKYTRRVALALAALVLLGILFAGILSTEPARRYALGQITARLAQEGIGLRVKSVDIQALALFASLRDMEVYALGHEASPFLRADKVSVRLFWSIGFRKPSISGIVIERPSLAIHFDKQGRSNLPTLKPQQPGAQAVSIGELSLVDASLHYTDAHRDVSVSIPKWSGKVRDLDANSYRIELAAESGGTVRYQSRSLDFSNAAADFDYASNALTIRNARLQSSSLTLSAKGSIEEWKSGKLRIESTGDAAVLAAFTKFNGRIRGVHSAQMDLSGQLSSPDLRGHVQATDFWFDRFGPIQAAGDFQTQDRLSRVRFQELRAEWGKGSISGTGDLALNDAAGQSALRADFRGFTATQLAQLAARPNSPVSGVLSGSMDLRFPALKPSSDNVRGVASIHIDPAPGLVPVGGDLRLQADVGRTTATISFLSALGSTIVGDVTLVKGTELSGSMQVAVADASLSLEGARNAGLFTSAIPAGFAKGKLDAAITLGGTLNNPQAQVSAESRQFFLASSVAGSLTVDAAIERDKLDLRALRYESPKQFALLASGKMTGSQLDFKGDLTHASAKELASAAGATTTTLPDGPIHGTFKVSGVTQAPQLDADVDSKGLSILNQPLGQLRATAHYSGDVLTFRSLRLTRAAGQGSLDAAGSWNTRSQKIAASATLRAYRLDMLELADKTRVRMILDGSAKIDSASSSFDLQARDLSAGTLTAKSATLKGSVAGKNLQATAQVPEWKAKASLTATLTDPMPAQFTASFDESPIEALSADAAGRVTAQASGTLHLGDPRNTLRAEAQLQKAAIRIRRGSQDYPEVRLDQATNVKYDGKYLDFTPMSLSTGVDSRLTASGHVPLNDSDRTGLVQVQGDIDLDVLTRVLGIVQEGAIKGRLRAEAVLKGGGTDWDPAGRIELVNAEAAHPALPAPLTSTNATLALRDKQVSIDSASASWLGGLITLGGRLPVGMLFARPNPGKFEITGDAANLKLEGLSAALGSPVSGETSVRFDLRGESLDPSLWEGRMQATALKVRIAQADFEQQSPLTVSLSRNLATIEPFTVIGQESSLRLSGSLSLEKPNPLALRIAGKVNAALLQLFTPEILAEGEARVDIAVTGTIDSPRMRGQLELAGVQGEIAAAQAVFEEVKGKIELDGKNISIARLTGQLNGGPMEAKGTAALQGRALGSIDLELHAKSTAWNLPEGLQTAADIDVRVTGNPKQYDVTGGIRILDGSYRESLVIERGLFRTLSATAGANPDVLASGERMPIRLDVKIETVDPIVVANDLLNGEVSANLRVVGSLDRPGLIGRLDVNEGANFYLGGRNYLVDRGAVTFSNQSRIEPVLDLLGHTRAGGVDINLQARGTAGAKLDTSFTSDPPLPEPDIISLLVSGRKLRDLRGSEAQVAQNQALSYLSGNLASTFSQQANRALGVNFVRIDPGLIADEAEPTARLTFGQDLTSRLGLVYSVNLRNSSDQIWVGRFDVTKRFQARLVRQSDDSFRAQFQHDIELGGTAPPESQKRGRKALRIGEVEIVVPDGDQKDADRVRSKLGLKSGKAFDFFALRKGVEKVKGAFADAGFPEVRVRTKREENEGVSDLQITVSKGPQLSFQFAGEGVSGSARRAVAKAWARSSFDSLRIRQATEAVKEDFAKDGYYAAQVEVLVNEAAAGRKSVTLTTARGRKYSEVAILLPGSSFSREAIAELVPTKDARRDIALHPERLASRLEQYYRQRGYLDAKTKPIRIDKSGERYSISLPIAENAKVAIGSVAHQGAVETTREVDASLQLSSGQVYDSTMVEAARLRAEGALAAAGRTGYAVVLDATRKGPQVDLLFRVDEGRKRVVSEVAVEGTQHVSDNLVRAQIGLKAGDVLTDAKLNEARRNLYSTGAFSLADIEVRDTDAATRLVARLREVRPFEIRYGVLYDTERGLGGIFDVAARNVLGSARTIGIRGRYDSRLREARAYFEQPSLLSLPLKFVNTGFIRREINPTFITDRTGGSSYLEYRLGKPNLVSFGYRLEQVHTFEREPDPLFPFDIRLRIAPLTAGFSHDTRDEFFDATRGTFSSHIAEWAPSRLGSQLQYAKYFGQYFYYKPLSKPTVVPWNGQVRPRIVYASGFRYGLAAGLQGQALVPSERFYTGGANSVRGFSQDRLGPSAGGLPAGGESIFVANNELRFPLYRFIDGVGFADAGNVFERWRDFRFGELRYTGGAGLRVRTPYFLLRVDYGFNLNRRPGDPLGRVFFGIGQAF